MLKSKTIAWSNTNIDYKSHGSKQTSTVTNSFYMYKVSNDYFKYEAHA